MKSHEKMFYSTESAGKELELGDQTIKSYINSGKLKAYKVGKQWRILRDDLIDFVKSFECNIPDK